MKRPLVLPVACGMWLVAFGAGAAQQKPPAPQQNAPAKGKQDPVAKAQENYRTMCQVCHGPAGKSPLPGMSLVGREWKHGTSTEAIAKVIGEGIPGTAMLPNKEKLTRAEILELARLVRTFDPKLKPEVRK